MKVILLENVRKVGAIGEIIEVKRLNIRLRLTNQNKVLNFNGKIQEIINGHDHIGYYVEIGTSYKFTGFTSKFLRYNRTI